MRIVLHRCLVIFALLCPFVYGQDSKQESEQPAAKPNVIFILADDLGYGDLGCFGQANFSTPRLDQMAAEGMRMTQHYAGSTVCAPSRACLLTGMHTGHVFNRANGDRNAFRNDPDDICIAKLLKDAGYTTAMIGKSGLACGSQDLALPNNKGFDHFFGYLTHRGAHRYYPEKLYRNGSVVEYPDNEGREGKEYSGDLFTKDALEFLDGAKDKPFFLHLSLQQPHADLQVPDDWRQKFAEKFDEQPHKGGFYRAEAQPKATFAGMVTYLDDAVGQVLDRLKALEIDDNTLVIFSSDNGAMSEGGWSRRNFNSSGALRGGKRDLYEGGIRVPTIVRWPGKVAAGASSDHISAFWDFVPTVCELVGIYPPLATDGISYLPTILGKGEQAKHDYLYWEFHEQGGKQAVRKGKWKAVRKGVNKNRNSPIELFDLDDDLHEDNNIAGAHPKVVAEMEQLMRDSHDGMGITDFAKPESIGVRKLLRGDDLSDWKKTNYGGEGEVTLKKGVLNMEMGASLTGVTYAGKAELPKCDFEIQLEARKVDGTDFFCGLTFPYKDSHASLIVGGWGGGVVGISSLDGSDAINNETTTYMKFEKDRWYRVRVKVTQGHIDAWIENQQVVDCSVEGRKVSVRPEVELSRPLGFCSFDTEAELRNVELRVLSPVAESAAK